MVRKKTNPWFTALVAFLAFDAAVTLVCGLWWCYQYTRIADAGIEALDTIQNAAARPQDASGRSTASRVDLTRPKPPESTTDNAKALRDAASHAAYAAGLGLLSVESIERQGPVVRVTGTTKAGKRVVVELRERFGPGGSATYDQARIVRR